VTQQKLQSAVHKQVHADIKAWLLKQHAYTLHRALRKSFPRNTYTVNNINDMWESDLIDVQGLAKYNDGVKYLLSVIDVFSKFLHIVPLKSKTGKDVTSAFQSILRDPRYLKPIRRRPVWLRTDKGKEFLNKSFQICRKPDIKCSVVERAHRTIRDKLYKYFTYSNTYRFIDVLQKFVRGSQHNGHV
jgi:hypothetical protein